MVTKLRKDWGKMKHLREWQKGKCQICGKGFDYIPQRFPDSKPYIPITCGKFDCLQEANKRGLLYKVVPEG